MGVSCVLASVCACPSHARIVSKRLHGSSWFFLAYRFPSVFQGNYCIPKLKVLPSVTLLQSVDLENLATAERDINKRQPSSVVYNTWWQQRTRQVPSTVDDDRGLLITLGIQLCLQRDGRLVVKHRRAAPFASVDTCFHHSIAVAGLRDARFKFGVATDVAEYHRKHIHLPTTGVCPSWEMT